MKTLLHLAREAVGNIAAALDPRRLVKFRPGAVKRPSRTHGGAAIPPRASLERGVPSKEIRLLREARKQAAGDKSVAREMWRLGFLPNKARLYDFAKFAPQDYLTDLQHAYTSPLNGPYAELLNNKPIFHAVFGARLPVPFAIACSFGAGMIWLTEAKGPFFAKPACGDRGRGIVRGCFEGDSVRLNGRLLGRMEFQAQLAATGEPYILTAAVEQHPEMASFFPETVNTVRVLMMREPSGEAFVACAVLRLGTSSSGGVDNFSKGGLSFWIDSAVGKIGQGRRKTGAVFENHPDTGAPVSGCSIPHWLAVIDCCHAAMVQQPGLQYVGWDVVVARDGPVLIEGNNKSDVNLIQAHRPLLANSRVRSFYERHGLLRHVPTTSL